MGDEVGVGEGVGLLTSGSFMPSPEPVRQPMSRVRSTGEPWPGLPSTSAVHRLFTGLNDPEVTMPRSLHPALPPVAVAAAAAVAETCP